ncbi:hypothetical protein SKAU_G00345260 [Synaphobranchus kaupii]|uniref:Uncharacterized protein n=1 Tax=Synaphobranchus kaupii TaxID=118154 RepID=A0A9Q1EJD2_SYNKA|nr:hypothetical protein SKAU_G00345260 [Synaphobranchus kaupii]
MGVTYVTYIVRVFNPFFAELCDLYAHTPTRRHLDIFFQTGRAQERKCRPFQRRLVRLRRLWRALSVSRGSSSRVVNVRRPSKPEMHAS